MGTTYRVETLEQRSTVDHVSKMYGDLPVNRAMCTLAQQAALLLSVVLKATGLGFAGSVAASLLGLSNLCASVRGSFAMLTAPTSIAGLIESVMKGGEGSDLQARALDIISKLLLTLSEVADIVGLLAAQGLFSLGAASGIIPMIALGALALGALALAVRAWRENAKPQDAPAGLAQVKQQRDMQLNKAKIVGGGLLALFGTAAVAASFITPLGSVLQALAAAAIAAYCVMRLVGHWSYDKPSDPATLSAKSVKPIQISTISEIAADDEKEIAWQQEKKSVLEVVESWGDQTLQMKNFKVLPSTLKTAAAVAEVMGSSVSATLSSSASAFAYDELELPDAALNFVKNPNDPKGVCKLMKAGAAGTALLNKFSVLTVSKDVISGLGKVSLLAEFYLAGDELVTNFQAPKADASEPEKVQALKTEVHQWKKIAAVGRATLAATMGVALFFSSLAIGIVGCIAGLAMTVAKVASTLLERTSEWRLSKAEVLRFEEVATG